MKKLITVVALVISCASLQAANYVWGFQNEGSYVDANGNELATGGTAFLYLGTVTATETAFGFTGTTLITSAGYDEDTMYFGQVDSNSAATSDLVENTTSGQAYSLILVDKEVTTLADYEGNYFLYTATSTEGSDPMTGATWAEFVRVGEVEQGSWSTMSVPEPTSGLLLILGMAGLALRRKHA